MDADRDLVAFAAFSQEYRLQIVRLLVTAGPVGKVACAPIVQSFDDRGSRRLVIHFGAETKNIRSIRPNFADGDDAAISDIEIYLAETGLH